MSEKITGKKKNIMLVTAIVVFGLLLVGGTYAYQLISASITNGSYDIVSACFDIDYDEGEAITGTLFQSSGPKGGLSGEVTMNIMSDCSLTGIGTITLHVKDGTSSILLSEGALKYAVYDDIDAEPLSEGAITYVGDIDIYSDFELTWEPVTYYIYIWLDGNIADNDYVNASFDGYIGASAENVMPNEVVTINFDTQGGTVYSDYTTTTVGENVFTVPMSGEYRIEVWGAQGGSTSSYRGGYGGYSVGEIELDGDTLLYVNVGGQGETGFANSVRAGGYNGGGIAQSGGSGETNRYISGGGGATHVALVSGELHTLSEDVDNVIVVAGGGGGGYQHTTSGYYGIGGDAGGYIGNNGGVGISGGANFGTGGTQLAGGFANGLTQIAVGGFGYGGDSPSDSHGSAGGGGYYGGGGSGAIAAKSNSAGGGGSGYIGNSFLTDKAMYCYNCATSTDTDTLTYSTTNVDATAISQYAKIGDGAAKITPLLLSKEVTYGGLYGDLPVPRKLGFEFKGWYTSPTGGTKVNSDTVIKNRDDHTLYAVWESTTVYLFNKGDQCVDVTGGWTSEGGTIDSLLAGDMWYAPTVYGAGVRTTNMIDFTNFTTLKVNLTYVDGIIAINVSTSSAWGTATYPDTTGVISLDVSEVTGEHYVWISAAGGTSSDYQIDQVWLE